MIMFNLPIYVIVALMRIKRMSRSAKFTGEKRMSKSRNKLLG